MFHAWTIYGTISTLMLEAILSLPISLITTMSPAYSQGEHDDRDDQGVDEGMMNGVRSLGIMSRTSMRMMMMMISVSLSDEDENGDVGEEKEESRGIQNHERSTPACTKDRT